MPGIAGIIAREGRSDGPSVERMVRSMTHEPFHKSGTYLNPRLGCSLGWVCHAGSFSDCLPVWNQARDLCLVFSGEHFADRAEVDRLRAVNGVPDDASSLIQAYEALGMRFFETLNGAFCGLVVDLRENKVVLFNDRFGLSRVYCHENSDGFYFASEAKALLGLLPQLRRLDLQSFGELFACGCALQNRSLFTGISLLPAASAWTFRPGQGAAAKQTYFQIGVWEKQAPLPASDYYERLKETFTRILPRYFRGKQRLALSLTGGLDSRMIIAGAKPAPDQLPCYTFGGMYRECADVKLARTIAHTARQSHEVIAVTPEFFAEFPSLAARTVYYSDGAMDVTGAVELFANRRAREIAPVRMTGNYGSEVLRGNVAFKAVSLASGMFEGQFAATVDRAAATYASERQVPRTEFIVSKQVPWHHYARLAVEQSQLTVRSPFLDNELVSVAYQAPTDVAVNKDLSRRLIADCDPALAGIPTDRGVAGRPGVPAGKFKVFCQEFLPRAEYVYDYGMPQWLAKVDRFTAPLHVERLFLGRQKFYHFRVWYRDELSQFVKDVLLDPRSLGRPYLDGRRVEQMVTAHVSGRGNYTSEIHKLLTAELIQRQLLEPN